MIDFSHGLETRTCRLLLAHWLEARGTDPMPRRDAIDPGVLLAALPHMLMLNMVTAETATYRLVGTAHRARWGIELTGHVWGEFLETQQRIDRTQRLWQAIGQPCGFAARYEVVFASGAHDPVETLLLPLRPNRPDGNPIMIGASISVHQTEWVNQPGSVASRTAERFRFLDLGYGVPPV
ncbi:MAG TPA: PAS domain-containing protein [Bradyrhizobium sp.]